MRWPDIFFKAKLPKRENDPAPVSPDEPKDDPVADAPAVDPAGRPHLPQISLPPAPVHPRSSDTSVMKDMAEADTLRELTRSGGIRLVKRDFSSLTAAPPPAPTAEIPAPPVEKTEPPPPRVAPAINLSGIRNPAPSPYPAATTIFRRRTKMADVARIVLPPRREEAAVIPPPPAPAPVEPEPIATESSPPPAEVPPPPPESAGTVIPASFPVNIPTGSVMKTEAERVEEKPVSIPEVNSIPEVQTVPTPEPTTEPEQESRVEEKSDAVPSSVEPPKNDPAPASENTSTALTTDSGASTKDKKEFVLSNGERILGHILSETPESIYINHDTLGVLTIPRAQIAQRPVEIILINGDRIVGDIIAETSDSLFVRHASLGILTVPRSQRSTRVVEAILKDGDRILGEVLGETENFTVIRSATLGTVAVPHNRVAMLNRRAEQVQMKALPPATPELENKQTN